MSPFIIVNLSKMVCWYTTSLMIIWYCYTTFLFGSVPAGPSFCMTTLKTLASFRSSQILYPPLSLRNERLDPVISSNDSCLVVRNKWENRTFCPYLYTTTSFHVFLLTFYNWSTILSTIFDLISKRTSWSQYRSMVAIRCFRYFSATSSGERIFT